MQTTKHTSLTNILPADPIVYKEQIKRHELVTKLRIIRLVYAGYGKTVIARKFSCHRNTVGNIIRDFEEKMPRCDREYVLQNKSITIDKIEVLLDPIKNKPSTPKSNTRSAVKQVEDEIVRMFEEEEIKVGVYRMKMILGRKHMHPKNSLEESLSNMTIGKLRGIYKRNKLKKKRKRSSGGRMNHLYDYKALSCFEHMHFDTKHILDKKTLPETIYQHYKDSNDITVYEWNLIDARSRFRFMGYSHNLNSEFGLRFLVFSIQFIRYCFGVWDMRIKIGQDNGVEFCSGSKRKEEQWNKILMPLNAQIYTYHNGHDIR